MPEKNLQKLLSSINPSLHKDNFVFCSVNESKYKSLKIEPQCVFRESEGVTLILEQSVADAASLNYQHTWAMITCEVNSDLTAVGFLAAMSNVLAEHAIPVNPVSAYHHDHLFIPSERAEQAMNVLRGNFGKPKAPPRDTVDDIRALIPQIMKEHKANKAALSLLNQGVALIRSKFGFTLPDDMRVFYERIQDVKIFDRYQMLSLQKTLDTDRTKLPNSWMPFCETPSGGLIAIDLSNPSELYPVIDLDNQEFDHVVIALSFTDFIDKLLSGDDSSNYWSDQSRQCGTAVVHLNNEQLRRKYEDYWKSLSDEEASEACKHDGCGKLRIKLSVFCKQHQFEQMQKMSCPFTSENPHETLVEYRLKNS